MMKSLLIVGAAVLSLPLAGGEFVLVRDHQPEAVIVRDADASGTVDRELEEGVDDLVAAVEGKRVYLSIDKDVLDRAWARTDWSQGMYSLDVLKGWLDRLLRLDVVAVDVCGELAPAQGATPEDLRVNCETNVELQEFILDYLKR